MSGAGGESAVPGIQQTEKYQVLPDMPPEQFEALKADIAERGVLTPIDVDEEGYILDGHHRYRACRELGITEFPTVVRPGLSDEDRRMFARKTNMLRRHLNRKQIRGLIAEQLKDTPSWANNRIAGVLGVDSKTVKTIREILERTSEIPKLNKFVGADGNARTVKQKRPPAIMATNTNELSRILKRVEEGGNLDALEGFMGEAEFGTLYDKSYNPFAHCDADGVRAWHLFMLFLIKKCKFDPEGAMGHIEWVLQKQFKTPDDWLGDEGQEWRTQIRWKEFSPKLIRGWERFLADHDGKSLSDIEALLGKPS